MMTMNTKADRKKHASLTRGGREERVNLALRLIVTGRYDGEIKRVLAERYGCSSRTAQRAIADARTVLHTRHGRSRADQQGVSLARYELVVRRYMSRRDHGGIADRDFLLACKRIDELLGLEEPKRTELTTPLGQPLEVNHSHELSRSVLRDPQAHELASALADRINRN